MKIQHIILHYTVSFDIAYKQICIYIYEQITSNGMNNKENMKILCSIYVITGAG